MIERFIWTFILISIFIFMAYFIGIEIKKLKIIKFNKQKRKWLISYRYFYKNENDKTFSNGFGYIQWQTHKELVDIDLAYKDIETRVRKEFTEIKELTIIFTSISEIKYNV